MPDPVPATDSDSIKSVQSPADNASTSPHTVTQWTWELLALLGGVAMLIGMIVLLAKFDGASPFEWHGITLNAIISILSVTLKVLTLFALAECVGQWKWILGSQGDRSLMEFERIDRASRGPLGCLFILGRIETPWVLRLGVLLTVLAVALDPFAQQLIRIKQEQRFLPSPSYHYMEDNSFSALAGRSEIVASGYIKRMSNDTDGKTAENERVYRDFPSASPAMEWAISGGVYGFESRSPVSCPSANCTWPSYNTIGVCSRCSNVTDQLNKVDGFIKVLEAIAERPLNKSEQGASAWALPNGHFIANLNDDTTYDDENNDPTFGMTAFGTGDPGKTVTMQDLDGLIWSSSVIQIDYEAPYTNWNESIKWRNRKVIATECAIYYCVKRVETSFQDNVVNETSVERTEALMDPIEIRPPSSYEGKYPGTKQTPSGKPLMEWDERFSTTWMEVASFHFPDDPSQPRYNISVTTIATVGAYVRSMLRSEAPQLEKGRSAASKLLGENATGFNGYYGSMGTGDQYFAYGTKPKGLRNFMSNDKSGVNQLFASLTTSITNEMRQGSDNGTTDASLRFGNLPAVGSIGQVFVFYEVTWPWIALHAAILVGGVVFCVLTVWDSLRWQRRGLHCQKPPVWKTHSLAVLKQGLTTGQVFRDVWGLSQMEQVARAGPKVAVPSDEERILLQSRDGASLKPN